MATLYNAAVTGYGVVPTTATANAPTTLYDRAQDVSAGNLFHICHTGTADGTTASGSWLKVKVTDLGGQIFSDLVLPGKDIYLQEGLNTQTIRMIEAWTLAPNSSSAGAANVCVTVGITSKR